jgi:GMP synthase-like glutamine amidotransferase
MRALVIANTGDDDAGYVGERLSERGFSLETRHRDKPELPANLNDFDLVVMLGSDWSVYWEHVQDDVDRESELVRQAAAADIPVLAICYGGQLMSHALGGSVEAADPVEIGWFDITTDNEELAPSGRWFQYHVDKFTAPKGAQVLASSSAGTQAYRLGRMLALQFHPEVSPDIIRRWGSTATNDAGKYGVDLEAVYVESDERASESRRRCHGLVDAFLDQVAFTA